MAALQDNLNSQHADGSDQQPENYAEKSLATVKRAAAVPETRSITNIYYDCLELIFEFLDLTNLLNVAQTCKRLQIAAAAHYYGSYRQRQVVLKCIDSVDTTQHGILVHGDDAIDVTGMTFCLPFLRCFGPKLDYLCVIVHTDTIPCCYLVDEYLNKYCADNIVDVDFLLKQRFSPDAYKKPFTKLKSMVLRHGNLNQISRFVDKYPELCRLETDGCSIRHPDFVVPTLPQLVHLHIDISCHLAEKSFIQILRSNKQLRCINLFMGGELKVTMTKLLDMLSENTSLKAFLIKSEKTPIIVDASELQRFANEHGNITDLDLCPCELGADDAIAFMEKIVTLNSIRFRVKKHEEYTRLVAKMNSKWTQTDPDLVRIVTFRKLGHKTPEC